ncbi:MAG: MaoC family dehydratase [Candidatus Rokubacteria bacterium]|nr:MaoC family dehydratase [Candidatus Rokubacteria bacterium]
MGVVRAFTAGDVVPSLVKHMTQEAINAFEGSSGRSGPSQFTDEETARHTLGTRGTVASGRMSLSFALELLRRYFGADLFNRGGMVDVRFLRPVRPGDTLTFTGHVTGVAQEANGTRVIVEVAATNEQGETTAIGTGHCLVPRGFLPPEEG